jgi:TupA-like ATPgrasp
MHSSLLPFEVRARIYWHKYRHTWIARRPDDFMGKLHWKLLKDRRPVQTMFADRIAVRDYVARRAGARYLAQCYASATDPAEIDRSAIPREFVAKPSHASGGVWIVSDEAPAEMKIVAAPDARGPLWTGSGWNHVLVRPEALDWDLFVKTFRAFISRNYARRHYVEWGYLNVPSGMIVEELLRGPERLVPLDYKFFCFNGRPRLIHVVDGRFAGAVTSNLYLPDWTPVEDADWPDGKSIYPHAPVSAPPASLEEMVEVATALSQDADFVRVDLYSLGGRIVFGELTNSPGGGIARFEPPSFDAQVGSWWAQPYRYRADRR